MRLKSSRDSLIKNFHSLSFRCIVRRLYADFLHINIVSVKCIMKKMWAFTKLEHVKIYVVYTIYMKIFSKLHLHPTQCC